MDPNALLAEIRDLTKRSLELPTPSNIEDLHVELAEKVEALDEWLSKGGFLPDAWVLDDDHSGARDVGF